MASAAVVKADSVESADSISAGNSVGKIGHEELDQSLKDWEELSAEYSNLSDLQQVYRQKLDDVLSLQKKCVSGVRHQRYRLSAIQKQLGHVKGKGITDAQKTAKENLNKDILRRKAQLSQIEDYLPRPSGTYLKVILGSINMSILDKEAKYQYKEQYEQFKLIVMLIGMGLSFINLYANNRVLDLLFMFLIVWYYCTLTIRESILRVNGSKIKGWWRAHHFISTALGGVLLVWGDGPCYQAFRNQLMYFNIYLAFLSYLQFHYQRGCLYRLKSLGFRNNEMDITIDGFHSWMWKGLTFLLPFLIGGYIWQLYNAYALHQMSKWESATWPVPVLAFLFLVLGSGNIFTISLTIFSKIRETQLGHFKLRFTRSDKNTVSGSPPGTPPSSRNHNNNFSPEDFVTPKEKRKVPRWKLDTPEPKASRVTPDMIRDFRTERLDKFFWTHKRSTQDQEQTRKWFTLSAERVARKRSESGRDIGTLLEQAQEAGGIRMAPDQDPQTDDSAVEEDVGGDSGSPPVNKKEN